MVILDYSGNMELEKAREYMREMEDPIIIYMYARSRYLKNDIVYEPGGIKIKDSKGSYFGHFFERSQKLHAEMGRFKHAGEVPFIDEVPEPIAEREPTHYLLGDSDIDINGTILGFYIGSLGFLCEPGNNSDQYGDAVICDINALGSISPRIIKGGIKVADAKYKQYKEAFDYVMETGGPGAEAALMNMITVTPQEVRVFNSVLKKARNHGVRDPGAIHDAYKWIVHLTKDVQRRRLYELYGRNKIL